MNQKHRALGPMIGLIVILAIILIGGVYFYTSIRGDVRYENQNPQTPAQNETVPSQNTNGNSTSSLPTSTDSDSIQADLNTYGGATIDNINPDF